MEQRETHLARLEAGIDRLVEALHAARQERDAARDKVEALRASARQELARLHTTVEQQERELTALRSQRQLIGERLHALQGRLNAVLAEEHSTGATPTGNGDHGGAAALPLEELTLR